ncbi:MAG: hypothetical protein ACLP0J_15185 [Solirubrobacteraceae bacterium]
MTSADQYEETNSDTLRLDYERARARSIDGMAVHLADERLLRKPATKQGRRIAEQRERLSAEAARQLAGRVPYDGEVSVEIAVLAGEELQPPQARDVVKAHLDLLAGLAYHDDRQITHLNVFRSALDHPAMIAGIKRYGRERPRAPETLRTPRVLIEIEPVEQYTFAYDRARRLAEQQRERDRYGHDDDDRPPSPWHMHWTESDYVELEEMEREYRALRSRSGPFADQLADFARERIAEQRTRFLLDTYLGAGDRPGALAADTRASLELVPDLARHLFHQQWPGGVFHLRPPGGGESRKAWRHGIRTAIDAEAERWRAFTPTIETRLGLDIALRHPDALCGDLDNIAHDVLVAFEERYCEGRRGSVVAYRAYRAEGPGPDLRVLVMPSAQLRALEEHIESAERGVIDAWETEM